MNWIDYFLEFAKTASLRSTCMEMPSGAVIVNKNNKIVSTGYNGAPKKVVGCTTLGYCFKHCNFIKGQCRSVEAEINAIIQAGIDNCEDGTLYIFGTNRLSDASKRIIMNSGLTNIYLKENIDSAIIKLSVEDIAYDLSYTGTCSAREVTVAPKVNH